MNQKSTEGKVLRQFDLAQHTGISRGSLIWSTEHASGPSHTPCIGKCFRYEDGRSSARYCVISVIPPSRSLLNFWVGLRRSLFLRLCGRRGVVGGQLLGWGVGARGFGGCGLRALLAG